MSLRWRQTTIFLICLCYFEGIQGRETRIHIKNDDRETILLSKPFGYGSHGHLELELANVKVHWSDPVTQSSDAIKNYDRFTFYLADSDADQLAEDPEFADSGNRCEFARMQNVQPLASFSEPKLRDMIANGGKSNDSSPFTFQSGLEDQQGVYLLFFANCEAEAVVSFDIIVRMYNTDAKGDKNFLSVGEIELPVMYLCTCILFTIGLGMWGYSLYANRKNVHSIHYLMAVLALFKVLTLLSQAGMYHYISVTGSPDGWNIAYYVFTFFRGIFFFVVVILIGTGWSYMTPFLGENEKRVLMIVVPLQVIANIAIIIMDEFSPAKRTWFTWRDIMHLLDIICCCAVLFPIVWRIKHLRDAAQTDGKAERSVQQLTLFRQFYVMVVIYIYFTRIVVYLLQTTLPFEMVWLSTAAGELATLLFYTMTAVQFRPHESSTYFKLVADTEMAYLDD